MESFSIEDFAQLKRTHTCGELKKSHSGQKVILNGFKSLFIPFAEKSRIYNEAKTRLSQFE